MGWPWRRTKARRAAIPLPREAVLVAPALPPEPMWRLEPPVRLGFADGTELELAAGDPRARALQAVADLLVQDSAAGADN